MGKVNAPELARLRMDFSISFSYAPLSFFFRDSAVEGPGDRFEETKYSVKNENINFILLLKC